MFSRQLPNLSLLPQGTPIVANVVTDYYSGYWGDSWKMRPDFTVNFGLGWEHETNVLNYDLPKPQLLAPIYGSDLSPTKKEYKNFAPAAGFAWTLHTEKPTVIRGGDSSNVIPTEVTVSAAPIVVVSTTPFG